MAEMPELQALIDDLRTNGAAERDPVRFAYISALTRRASEQPEMIRQVLGARIRAAAKDLAARPSKSPAVIPQENTVSPLAELLAYIGQHADAPSGTTRSVQQNAASENLSLRNSVNASPRRSGKAPELKSVAYFRNTWSRLSTEQHLTQTLAQAPENAGPMNSQHLVLRSLQVMHDTAPDYLQAFMSYVDTLIWLEHADPTKQPSSRSSTGEGDKKTRTTKRSTTRRPSNAG